MQQAPSSLSSSQLQQKTVLNCKTCGKVFYLFRQKIFF